jgi:hypothetical protein
MDDEPLSGTGIMVVLGALHLVIALVGLAMVIILLAG